MKATLFILGDCPATLAEFRGRSLSVVLKLAVNHLWLTASTARKARQRAIRIRAGKKWNDGMSFRSKGKVIILTWLG